MMSPRIHCIAFALIFLFSLGQVISAQEVIPVTLKNTDGAWQLLRGGEPYQIRGAGGEGSLKKLAEFGGNSTRTWGVDENTQARLDEAHKHGISVMLGIWIEHERHGFDYTDFNFVSKQIDKTIAAVNQFKDHPAVLAWGIGNEMEGKIGDNPVIWTHIEHLARRVKELDPNHPTVTVIAEIGGQGEKVKAINKLCPSIDIIGINSYGGSISLPERMSKLENSKPYVVTEFGPLGPWEVGRNVLDSIDERTSTTKAETYRKAYEGFVADSQNCLGSYAFLWGNKQEATATWFGILLHDGRRTAALDALSELWTGTPVANRCPQIDAIDFKMTNQVDPGGQLQFTLKTSDPENDEVEVEWMLMADSKTWVTGGDFQKTPPSFPDNIISKSSTSATISAPAEPGVYRIYAIAGDRFGGAATANVVFRVKGMTGEPGAKATLPLVVYDEPGETRLYSPSGYMGDVDGIKLDDACRDNPKAGTTCMKTTFDRTEGWSGVVWQHPENDWGEVEGGMDLRGATKLTFWARGKAGEEKVKFGFGILGRDKKFFDTASGETEVTLTQEWEQYSFDLQAADLSRIKTAFYWSTASSGKPLTFYLDDIRFE